MRIAIAGLLALSALAAPASVAAAAGRAHSSIGFEPIPLSVAADGAGHVYLSNPLSSRAIQQYSSDGKLLTDLGDFSPSGDPFRPRYVTTDAAGTLYVYDGPGERVSVLGPGGETVRGWKAAGGRDLAVGPDGTVYLATSHEILRFSADGSLLGKWGASQFVTQWYDRPPTVSPGRPRLSATVRGRTAKRVATFRFHSRLKGVRYSCRLSGELVAPVLRRWRRCSSPQRYAHLRPGLKTFHVRAVKGAGVGPEAKRSWLIVAGRP